MLGVGLSKSGRGLRKVGGAYEKYLVESGRGLVKMGVAYAKNILRLRRWSNKSIKRSISFHNGTKGIS